MLKSLVFCWLRRWKERKNFTFKTISGESNSVTPEMVNAWSEISLPTLLYNYDLKDIYNADEFQTKHTNSSQKSAQVESWATGIASANAAVDKLPMFVIGKARKPRCFKNVKFLPCRWDLVRRVGTRIRPKVSIRRKKCCASDQ